MKHSLSRVISLMLAVVMLLSMAAFPVSAENRYVDVAGDSWYSDAVEYVTEKGIMNGVSDNEFAPNTEVTRAMFVTVLARLAGAETNNDTSPFADVPAGKWYTGAVAWAASKGIVNGVSATRFAPNRSISRQDMCTIIARFINAMNYNLTVGESLVFTDAASISGYARDAVDLCSGLGLVEGVSDGVFAPRGTSIRAQIAMVMMRLGQKLDAYLQPVPRPAQNFAGAADDGMTVLVDAPEGALPENTDMTVSRVVDAEDLAAIQSKVNGELFAAADISFSRNGVEIEPDAEVEVSISVFGLETLENPAVVHVKDDGTVERVNDFEIVNANRGGPKAVRFHAKDFSVYAVVEEGEDDEYARLEIQFFNGETQVGDIFVKNQDLEDDDVLALTLYDPGPGQVPAGQMFKGWTTNPNYTAADASSALTIEQIRDTVKTMTFEEGMEPLKYYAMILSAYNISYLDELGVVIKIETLYAMGGQPFQNYEIKENYTPRDQDSKFEGWLVLDDSGNPVGNPNPVGTKMNVSSNIVFRASVPKGHWVIFKENGTNVSYTPPQFVPNGNAATQPANPTRTNHTFGGWYKDEACTQAYNFSTIVEERTVLYAKWTAFTNVNYTVIVWKQRMSDTSASNPVNYDYYNSWSLSGTTGNAATGVSTSTNSYVTNGDANETRIYNARVNNSNVAIDGYHLLRYDQNVTVKADGSTVVNVYYVRNTVTFKFYKNTSGNWDNNAYNTTTTNSNVIVVSGLYGESFTWPDSGNYVWSYFASRTEIGNMSFQSALIPDSAVWQTHPNNVHFRYGEAKQVDVEFYLKDTSGNYPDSPNQTGKVRRGSFTLSDAKFPGYKVVGYRINNGSFQSHTSGYVISNISSGSTLRLYYDPLQFRVVYMDGAYYTGKGEKITEPDREVLKNDAPLVNFGASIASYNKGGADYYEPTYDRYTFAGWFTDKTCTTEYTFTSMSNGNITVYAKWILNEYRVFLHPCVTQAEDGSLDMGDQATSFRVNNGEQIAGGNVIFATRDNFDLIGWYTDPGYDNAFNFSAFYLNDTTVTTPYNKTEETELTTPYATVETGKEGVNKDKDENRFWITKKLDLYAKWRPKVPGAYGIYVLYDAGDGAFENGDSTWTDPVLYLPESQSAAGGAPGAPAPEEGQPALVFKHWVLYTVNASNEYVATETTLEPGQFFTVHMSDAQSEHLPESEATEEVYMKYTVKLVAVYGEPEVETPSHIYWYANNGTEDVQKEENVTINKGYAIPTETTWFNGTHDNKGPAGLSYEGHVFLGWARVDNEGGTQGYQANLNLGVDDLFLRWIPDTSEAGGHFEAKNEEGDSWFTSSKVACDENQPYHDLYAVWSTDFYVYDSSTGKLTAVTMPAEGETVNLLDYVDTENAYYGGYFKTTKLVAEKNVEIAMHEALFSKAAVRVANVAGATLYDGTASFTGEDNKPVKYWERAEAYQGAANIGTAMTPVGGTVYYVKMVPHSYITMQVQKQIYYVIDEDNGTVYSAYLVTGMDDALYANAGFNAKVNNGTENELAGRLCKKFQYLKNHLQEGDPTVVTLADVFPSMAATSYLMLGNVKELANGDTLSVQPFWKTLDGIEVVGQNLQNVTVPSKSEMINASVNPTRGPQIGCIVVSDLWIDGGLDR